MSASRRVDALGAGHLHETAAALLEAEAEVDIFRAVEVGLVDAADRLPRRAFKQLTRTDGEVDLPRRLPVDRHGLVVPPTVQRAGHLQPQRRGHACGLFGALARIDGRAERHVARHGGPHGVEQASRAVGAQLGIAVEQQHVGVVARRNAEVAAASHPEVAFGPDQAHPGVGLQVLGEERCGFAAVVDDVDRHLDPDAAQRGANRRVEHRRLIVPGEDHDIDGVQIHTGSVKV